MSAPSHASPAAPAKVSAAGGAVELARQVVERLGGRYSLELGIDVDASDDQVEQWALFATLLGNRISATIAANTYRTLAQAGVRTLNDAGTRSWDELVALLDAGGYVRYDFRTATRLLALAAVIGATGGVAALGRRLCRPDELERALDELPGWGPVTIRLFLRELRGVWPGARPPLDPRALEAAKHLGLTRASRSADAGLLRVSALAAAGGLDRRDLEAGLVRLALAHRGGLADCPGRTKCRALSRPARVSCATERAELERRRRSSG